MQSAFEWTSTATKREYLTGAARITLHAIGEEHALGSNDLEADARLCELRVELPAILEEQTGNPRNATEIWLDLLRGEAIKFYPDAGTPDGFAIIPDLSHAYTMMATRYGTLAQTRTLRFKAKTLYAPSDPFLDSFASFITIQ